MAEVTWYDVLGVARDASPAEIKAAWRDATDRFEPGSGRGQFALFNEAADVLLDPERRAAYDAGLAGPDDAEPRSAEPTEPDQAPESDRPEESAEDAAAADGPERRRGTGWRAPLAVPLVLVLIAVAAAVTAGVLALKNRTASQEQRAGDQAASVVERALPVVLSYDYRTLDASRDAAVRWLTPKYKKEYDGTFDKLIESADGKPGPAEQTKAVVKASVLDTAVVGANQQTAKLVVFVNQSTVKGTAAAKISQNRLTVTMTRSGDRWLVDNIVSY